MKKTVELVPAILLTSVLFCIGIYFIVSSEKSQIRDKFQNIFEDVIWIEMGKRVKDSNTFMSFSSYPAQKSDILKIKSEEGIRIIEKDSLYKQLTLEQRRELFLQTYLKKIEYPIQILVLDSLYADKLKKENPLIETAVRYIDNENGNVTDSKHANHIYTAYSTNLVELGVEKEMSVQGFYTLPLFYILYEARIPVIISVGVWLLITGLLFFILIYRRRKMENSIVYVPVKELEKKEEDVLVKITDTIYFHPKKKEIHYCQQTIITLSSQAALLFQNFIEAPDNFLSYEQIDSVLKWEKIDKIGRRRAQAINRLKEMLNPIPEITIENQNRKGYQLILM